MHKFFLILNLLPVVALAMPPMPGELPGDDRPPIHPMMDDKAEHLPPFLQQINLTEQQQNDIKNLFNTQHDHMRAAMEQEKTTMMALHQLSFSNNFNEMSAKELIDKSFENHKNLALQKAKLDNAIFKLLSPEQQEKLKSARFEFEHRPNR